VEAMDNNRRFDLTVYGQQDAWDDSPNGRHRGKNFTVATTFHRPVISPKAGIPTTQEPADADPKEAIGASKWAYIYRYGFQ
jgi:hypothetical protein